MIEDVFVTKLDIIDVCGGNVMHAMKKTSNGYIDCGEAYFSKINKGVIKAWKRHKNMTLNLIVPVGGIKFILFDDRDKSNVQFQKVILSKDNYCRLTVPPMIWMGFQGLLYDESTLLNIADIEHNPNEFDRINIEDIEFNWSN